MQRYNKMAWTSRKNVKFKNKEQDFTVYFEGMPEFKYVFGYTQVHDV